MTTNSVSALLENITNYQYNPAGIQSTILQVLSDITDGTVTIVDPTNPFVFCLESAAVMTSAFLAKDETSTRKRYALCAQTPSDLYLHMSDKDYINRFATPSKTKFSILIPKQELLDALVEDPATGIKKIVIPRNTYFTISNTIFSIQYPVEIRQLVHGGLQIVYDTDIVSPLQSLTTNEIQFEYRKNTDNEYIYFELDVFQFDIITNTSSVNSAVDFKIDVDITDQYYYTRVYYENTDGTWTEMKTTHSDQVYDINTPTAVITVVDKRVTIRIPQIYTGTGIINTNVRVDVYETKGDINMILWEYKINAFSANWLAIDNNDNTKYVAPLGTIKTIIIYSDSTVSGGSNGVSFDTLRTQVIEGAVGDVSIPITNAQLDNNSPVSGYTIVKNIDNITNRVFLATRDTPLPVDDNLYTPAGASIETISTTIDKLITNSTVIDNTTSITITQKTIYQNIEGVITIVTDDELSILNGLTNDSKATLITANNYLYTPFHYVIDLTTDEMSVRPYYLDNPEIITKLFVDENDTTLIQVNTGNYVVGLSDTGYYIEITTSSETAYKGLADNDVFVQLAFTPTGESDKAYLNGVLQSINSDKERVYRFDLSTNYNVDSDGNIYFKKFCMYNDEPRLTKTSLITDFDIIYSTVSAKSAVWATSPIDNNIGAFLLPDNTYAITQEKLRVRFGYSLDTLWARARTVISSVEYKKWQANVPRYYEADIYKTDENGSAITLDANNNVVMTLLHAKGDPVLNEDGSPSYLHEIGDIVLDSNNNPIVANTRGLTRLLDIMLIEGAYWFATETSTVEYRNLITNTIVGWLTTDLETISKSLLDQSNIYFHPNSTLGYIDVLVDNGLTKKIFAGQTLKVVLSVPTYVYNDSALKNTLSKTTINTIYSLLKKQLISNDIITSELRKQYGDDVISVQVTGLGGISNNYSVMTVINDSERCSIRKRLTVTDDNKLMVEEDIDISFVKYSVDQ